MKKIIAALAGLSLFAAAATAEGITFGSWGRGLWNVIANGQDPDGKGGYDDTIVSGIKQNWGGASPRTDLKVHGDSEHIGFALQITSDCKGNINTDSDTHIYIKPIEQITAYLGATDENLLRGDVCLPLWGWDRIGAVGKVSQEGWTFAEYLEIGQGASIIVTPIEGLTIGAAIDFDEQETGYDIGVVWGGDKGGKNGSMGGRYVVGYSIEGIGTIKAALDTRRKHVRGIGFNDDYEPSLSGVDGDVMEVAAAFDLTAVENLYASVGAVIPTDGKDIYVNAGGHYQLDALGIYALVGTKINAVDWKGDYDDDYFMKDAGKFGICAGVGLDYTLENGIGFFGEVQFANDVWMGANIDTEDWNKSNVTFGVGVSKSVSNGVFGIAFEGSTTGNSYTLEGDKFGFEVPVKFEYWF